MADSTNIDQLPTDPVDGGSINPSPKIKNDSVEIPSVMTLDNLTIQQIVNGIQKASSSGSTTLPSRDIPTSTQEIITDPNSNTNYIPKSEKYNLDFEEDETQITNNYVNQEKSESALEKYYDLLKIPLLLFILFFLFQLPIVKQQFLTKLTMLSKVDGNFNLNGLIVYSLLFGISYFILNHLLIQ
jgi:hypothetical protein